MSTNREFDRIPPFNLEAERSVLGSCLIDRDSLLVVIESLRAEDFYDPRHKTAFEEWYVGRKEKVLLEEIVEKNGKKYFQGYTAHYVKVAVELTENDTKLEQNEVIVVDIQGFIDENLLYGKVSIEF